MSTPETLYALRHVGVKPINLTVGKRTTTAHDKLVAGLTSDGAQVVRRKKGYSDYDVIRTLVRAGWLEERRTGPRGGVRYFTTPAGRVALDDCKAK
jgi:hypothetical protein